MREFGPRELNAKLFIGDKEGRRFEVEYYDSDESIHYRVEIPEGGSESYYPLYIGTSKVRTQEHEFKIEHPATGPAHIVYGHVSGDGKPAYLDGLKFDLPVGYRFDLGSAGRALIHGDSYQETEKFHPPFG